MNEIITPEEFTAMIVDAIGRGDSVRVGVAPGSPLAVGAGQAGETIRVDILRGVPADSPAQVKVMTA